MTREERIKLIKHLKYARSIGADYSITDKDVDEIIKALEQEPIDKSAMMYDIYMEGVNMTGEYQGCWVRFKDIEKIVNKYIGSEET